MNKRAFQIEVRDETLVVRGEKRFERERTEERYRALAVCLRQLLSRCCVVALPQRERPHKTTAHYQDGVLEVELAKREAGTPQRITVDVA